MGKTQAGDLGQDEPKQALGTCTVWAPPSSLAPLNFPGRRYCGGGVSRFVPDLPGSQIGMKNSRPLHQAITELPHPNPEVAAPCRLLRQSLPHIKSPTCLLTWPTFHPICHLGKAGVTQPCLQAERPRSHSLNTQAHQKVKIPPAPSTHQATHRERRPGSRDQGWGTGFFPRMPHSRPGGGEGAAHFPGACCVTSGLSRSHQCLQASSRRPQAAGRARPSAGVESAAT